VSAAVGATVVEAADALGYREMMRSARFSRWLMVSCLPLFWGCGDSSESSTSQRAISGRVLDAQSGNGIAEAVVELTSDALDRAETSTDSDGRFTLDVSVSDGVLFGTVSVEHRDYEQAPAASVYFDGADNVIEIALRRKASK
jgi:5-hydroxyisourate hydrolase-like protein (transthyretin family)